MSDFSLESPPADDAPQEYRVLARKYRPTRFADLIGQDAMVQTLGNAIAKDRIAHAFLMTGVRGVGKTSTARLIAKALNCIGPDGRGGPTIDPCGVCEPCKAITEGRFIDVVEMDAASHTGVDDMRDVIDSVRYAAVSGRYKIHIIDEVHMLSKSAFNALLKTLEEPPDHVKFIFATTELNKVPVTVLSRTQRFDLKRIPADLLVSHFAGIAEKEGAGIEEDALRLIAAAAEGSVRDGLSLLDQAIAHGAGEITAEAVRAMLGLSDRGRTRALLAAVLTGDSQAALTELNAQYELGVAPDMAIESLLETVHAITRVQVGAQVDLVMSAEGQEQLGVWANEMSAATLHRFWQLLLKGLEEVKRGTMALQTAEMVLLRLIHAAGMPDPGALMRALEEKTVDVPLVRSEPPLPDATPARASASAPVSGATADDLSVSPAPPEYSPPLEASLSAPAQTAMISGKPVPADYTALVAAVEIDEPMLGAWLYDDAAPVTFAGGELVLTGKRNPGCMASLNAWMTTHFGDRLTARFEDGGDAMTLHQQDEARREAETAAVLADPNVQRVFAAFPDAELTDYTLQDTNSRGDERRTAR
ncbi:DNA polymerase III subunit gamma/tau [Pacificimonas sp. WHA3]|uniref:DNA polymerase III subunit gamma/tau n=1 Tax=Pacificimonas pallii TaxID=2827236 RepID=A0ABS6S9Y2_9SPHN|nr:DNA polymerase III subunit gamma/tau [Pacificimonas pallii]MBV7255170.1 DNA polymerase III subunit gamma/tau [Pacificimonas pallii]